jgi:hypothetical protein
MTWLYFVFVQSVFVFAGQTLPMETPTLETTRRVQKMFEAEGVKVNL